MTSNAFICYKRDTAEDFASHLKSGLEGNGIHTFLDIVDIPNKFRGSVKWSDAINEAVAESRYFLLIITPGFEKSKEIRKEIMLARMHPDKEFVYFRHKDVLPNVKLSLADEELDLARQQQVRFDTKEDLLRKALRIIEGKTPIAEIAGQDESEIDKTFDAAISNFAAFYDQVFGARKIQKVYPNLFTPEEKASPGKADKICRVLETYVKHRGQFKQALQTIINLHRQYSKTNINALRDIVADLGFVVNDDLSIDDKEKSNEGKDPREIVKKYHEAVFDEDSNDPLPFKACPQCGSTKLERHSRYIQDDMVLFIECTECGWVEAQEM